MNNTFEIDQAHFHPSKHETSMGKLQTQIRKTHFHTKSWRLAGQSRWWKMMNRWGSWERSWGRGSRARSGRRCSRLQSQVQGCKEGFNGAPNFMSIIIALNNPCSSGLRDNGRKTFFIKMEWGMWYCTGQARQIWREVIRGTYWWSKRSRCKRTRQRCSIGPWVIAGSIIGKWSWHEVSKRERSRLNQY